MYRSLVEIVSSRGGHDFWYCYGKCPGENLTCEFLECKTLESVILRCALLGLENHLSISQALSIEEWTKIYERKDGSIEVFTVHLREVPRTSENTNDETVCSIKMIEDFYKCGTIIIGEDPITRTDDSWLQRLYTRLSVLASYMSRHCR